MLKYNAFSKGELCNGSTADSDSVCWGSNPYSPARTKHRKRRCFFSFWQGNRGSRTTVLAAKPHCTGFAFEPQSASSSLVSGKAKNLRHRRIPLPLRQTDRDSNTESLSFCHRGWSSNTACAADAIFSMSALQVTASHPRVCRVDSRELRDSPRAF